MKVEVSPPVNFIDSTIQLPVSKSVFNRYLALSYLAGAPIPDVSSDYPNDVRLMHSLLQFSGEKLTARDAGTVMRFGLAICSVTKGVRILKGSERMHMRPISLLVDALRQLGADIEYIEKENYPPLRISGRKLFGGRVEIDASVSSQFISALLMIAPTCENTVELFLSGTSVSSPYIDMTRSMMERFNVTCRQDGNVFKIEPQTYTFHELSSVLDWSAASFFYEFLALSEKGGLFFPGLFRTGLQGDEQVSKLFEPLGIETVETNGGMRIVKRNGVSKKVNADFIRVPDLVQPFVCTCFGMGIELHLTGLHNLHLKESDRLQAMISNLEKLGAELSFNGSNGMLKNSKNQLVTNELDAFDDHRMAMSLAPLCLKFGKLKIDGAQSISKSFPNFWNELKTLGFRIVEIS